jgi:hypothetical protein
MIPRALSADLARVGIKLSRVSVRKIVADGANKAHQGAT